MSSRHAQLARSETSRKTGLNTGSHYGGGKNREEAGCAGMEAEDGGMEAEDGGMEAEVGGDMAARLCG